MDNKQALTSTAMLAAIWEKKQKDNLELLLPFVVYSIGKVVSDGCQIENTKIAERLQQDFGFNDIPDAVMQKCFKRLAKKRTLKQSNKRFFLNENLDQQIVNIEHQKMLAEQQTNSIIEKLQEYLNKKKTAIFKKDLSAEETKSYFTKFLEKNGYFAYANVNALRQLSPNENAINYHIADFIINEYTNNTKLFGYINSVVQGLMLASIIYTPTEVDYATKINNVEVYFDSALLLSIFGFKSADENRSSAQLIKLLNSCSIPLKCFRHNYDEVYAIVDAYKHNRTRPEKQHGQTLEYFDNNSYSSTDMERVLLKIESYFSSNNISIVDMPSYSSDGSGLITKGDYDSLIGETELKDHLAEFMTYKNEVALDNDVKSISAIFALRKGKHIEKIEKCKAIFITSNQQLAYESKTFIGGSYKFVPLAISDLDFITLLWLKNYKNSSDLPTLKLIENARLSMVPTEEIRQEYNKKIDQMEKEPHQFTEDAACFRRLIYTESEKLMQMIDGNADNIDNLKYSDVEKLAESHINKGLSLKNNKLSSEINELSTENKKLECKNSEMQRKLSEEAEDKIKRSQKRFNNIAKIAVHLAVFAVLVAGIIGTVMQFRDNNSVSFWDCSLLILGVIGIIDNTTPRLQYIDRIIDICSNKWVSRLKIQERNRLSKIFNTEDSSQ